MRKIYVLAVGCFVLIASVGLGGYHWYTEKQVASAAASFQTPFEENVYVRFDMEIFDIITREYWQEADEGELAELYRLALDKVRGGENVLPSADRTGVAEMLATTFAGRSDEEQKQMAVDMGIVVLANLAPQGRSGLLSNEEERQLRDAERNINRERDLYATLDVEEKASVEEVERAFEEKKKELEADGSTEAQAQLAEAEYAKSVLTDEKTKAIYDETKIEPSLTSRIIGEDVLYIDLSQVTPATFEEFISTLQKTAVHPELTNLIIDVRGNVGGTLDFAKYLFGLFVGPNQYAFDLLRKGELMVERTPGNPRIESLENFEEIAILTDGLTQSTAELTTAMFKKHNMAKAVGTQTRGWGSVENTYPIETRIDEGVTYTVLLVNSLTLREDNEPIEMRGVDPDVDISKADWRQQLEREFSSASLRRAIIDLVQ